MGNLRLMQAGCGAWIRVMHIDWMIEDLILKSCSSHFISKSYTKQLCLQHESPM